MKKIALIILSAALAVLIAAGVILYPRYGNMQQALQDCEKRFSELKGKTSQVESQAGQLKSTYESLVSELKDQIQKQEVNIKNFQEALSFDKLCESLGHLFIEFAELHQRGEGVRIIDRMNALRISILE